MEKCMYRELEERRTYLGQEVIESIYFGGGTPSLLMPETILLFIDSIKSWFKIDSNPEITLEANPDDISRDFKGLEESRN